MQMEKTQTPCLLSVIYFFTLIFITTSASSSSPSSSVRRGVHPLDFNYFDSQVIQCKDGSNSFTKDRLNDDFCDCVDGTDEPGTSACPAGKFYCRNQGSWPRFLFSSRVNDHICDCCDGSDEFDGVIYCPNTCIVGGNIEYKTEIHQASNIILAKERKPNGRFDMIQNLKDLKILTLLQLITVLFGAFFLLYRHAKSRKRRNHR